MSQAGIQYLLKTPTDQAKAVQAAKPDKADFTTIGGLRSNSDGFAVNLIDITSKSSNNNRELLESSGTISLDISGSGVLQPSALTNQIRQALERKTARWFLIEEPSGDVKTFKGLFESFNVTGAHDGAVEFDFSLKSTGTLYKESSTGVMWNSGTRKFSNFQSSQDPYSIILRLSDGYAAAAIPADKQTAFAANLAAVNLLNANASERAIGYENTLRGDQANKFVFPFFLLTKPQLTGKKLQVLDTLDLPITPKYIGEYQDDTAETWVAYYIDMPLANNETIGFKINIFG